jgi:hypothetical protein
VPASIKLQEAYGEDLQVLFVESQGADRDRMEGFALRRKWFGTTAMWTTERPFDSGSRGLPNYVLIGADGRVIEKGSYANSKTEALIDVEIKAGRRAPEGVPKALQAAWKSFGKGDVGKALASALKVRERGELVDQADEAIASFHEAVGRSLKQVEWCIENGLLVEAQNKLEGMKQGLKGAHGLLERVAEIEDRISSPEWKAELDACQKFDRILRSVYTDGIGKKDRNRRALKRFVKSHAGTAAATRAQHLLKL